MCELISPPSLLVSVSNDLRLISSSKSGRSLMNFGWENSQIWFSANVRWPRGDLLTLWNPYLSLHHVNFLYRVFKMRINHLHVELAYKATKIIVFEMLWQNFSREFHNIANNKRWTSVIPGNEVLILIIHYHAIITIIILFFFFITIFLYLLV
jgi:hypothetical protein